MIAQAAMQTAVSMNDGGRDSRPDWKLDPGAESDHRIANSLALVISLIKAQAREMARRGEGSSPEQVSEVLEEVAGRIETVGRLHRLLSQDDGSVAELGAYLSEVCDGLFSALSSAERFTIAHIPAAALVIPAKQAIPLGLIVCEVVTNAVKYAHPAGTHGDIRVACGRQADGTVFVEVADDGVGLPEGFDPTTDGGQGLRLVRGLAGQLSAQYQFDDSGLGLRFRLIVPAAEMAVDEAAAAQ
jgi:two-component sensor histidine kinase